MKIALTALLMSISASSAMANSYVDDALVTYVKTIDRFNVGEITVSEVYAKQYLYLTARKDTGSITKAQYCFEAVTAISRAVEGLKEESRLGYGSDLDLMAAELAKKEAVAFCSAK